MKIFGITPAGLLATSIAVMMLWTCLAMERTTMRRATRDQIACLRTLRSLQRHTSPAAQPAVLPFPSRPRST